MNYVDKRFADMVLTPEKYNEDELHKIKNCLEFIRDCMDNVKLTKCELFLGDFVYRKENNISFDVKQLELEYGIEN